MSPPCCGWPLRPAWKAPLDVDNASYFLSTIELRVGREPGMTRWRKRLFVATSRITTDAANTSACPATAPSSWAHASPCSTD